MYSTSFLVDFAHQQGIRSPYIGLAVVYEGKTGHDGNSSLDGIKWSDEQVGSLFATIVIKGGFE